MKREVSTGLKILFLTGLVLCLFAGISFPADAGQKADSELRRVLQKAKEREQSLKTFVAGFEQTKKTLLLEEPLRSRGIIFFDISGKMLLKVTEPVPLKVLLKRGWITLFYPEWSKYEERYIGSDLLSKNFGMGRSLDEMAEHYDIELSPKRPSGLYHLHLRPKSGRAEKFIDRIEVLLNPESWLPVSISVMEKEGDITTITLEFKSLNEPLPEGTFDLELPDQR